MRKTDGLTKAIGILLFAAMLCYIGFAAAHRLTNSAQTALAVEASVTESAVMSGVVIREEEPVLSDREYIDISAGEGEKIAAGGTLATVYTSAEALNRALRLDELAAEIAEAKTEKRESAADTADGTAVYSAIKSMNLSVQSGRIAGLDSAAKTLAELVLRQDKSAAPEADVQTLEDEYARLLDSTVQDSETIISERAGLFSRLTDGFEDMSYAEAETLTPASLRRLLEEQRSGAENCIGRMIYGVSWYYAALMDAADAEKLTEGSGEELLFSRYCTRPLPAEVEKIGVSENGECVVLFSLDEGMAEMLSARKAGSELVFEEYSGIRVPTEGLYRYYAGYVDAADAEALSLGDTVTLAKGTVQVECVLAELGDASERDGTEKRLAVLCWPWSGDNALPDAPGAALLTGMNGAGYALEDLYSFEEQTECCCVFTMTGLQAERRRVVPVYAGEDFCLVDSAGEDALRAGNEVIVKAQGLYSGRVFD